MMIYAHKKQQSLIILLAAVMIFLSLATPLAADSLVTQIPLLDVPKGSAGLGFGYRSGTSPYREIDNISSITNDNETDLIPLYLYEGKYFFAHGTSAGIHLLDNDSFKIDILARYRFDRLEDQGTPFYVGIEERRQTIDAGLSLLWKNSWGELSTSIVHDSLNRHKGTEADLSYRYSWRNGRWGITPFASYIYQDQTLTDYYYGVDLEEARPDRPAYQTASSSTYRLGLGTTYYLNKNSVLFANFSIDTLDNTVKDSPLVDESYLASAYIGFSYLFGNTLDKSQFKGNKERFGEWSWRVNYGYTAHETFVKLHNGEVRKHDDIKTNLAGLTLGKLIKDGQKIDYWGRISFNRRLEKGLQDDFNEVNAYVMAMGEGFSPWSQKELFRYGFGFGFSYADRVPAVEQFKQDKAGKNAAHFLNYLEAQVDFPLRNLFAEKLVKDCYVGITLVHRSGIFASSDILGNVSGGSDVLTGHLECKQ